MADSWFPIAVALVSSGSPGNKLLFYHYGIQQVENGMWTTFYCAACPILLAHCFLLFTGIIET